VSGVLMIEPGDAGGVHSYALALVEALEDAGERMTFLTSAPHEQGSGPTLARFDRPGQDRTLARRFQSACKHAQVSTMLCLASRSNPGAVAHWQWPSYRFGAANAVMLRGRHPTVITVHNAIPHDLVAMPETWRSFYACADVLICHSDSSRRDLAEQMGASVAARAVVTPHGVGEHSWPDPDVVTKAVARSRLGLPVDGSLLLAFGSIRRYKNLDLLLRAWAVARPAAARLVIAGQCDDWAPYADLIEDLGVRDTVGVRIRWLPAAEVPWYMLAADAVALPYARIDASGVAAAAAWCGCPLLLADIPGFRSTWSDGEAAFAPLDVESWAHLLSRVFVRPRRLATLGQAARAAALARFSWAASATRHRDAYALARRRYFARMAER
jgi:glycosyltransferase involved in cell wall biosynthesis